MADRRRSPPAGEHSGRRGTGHPTAVRGPGYPVAARTAPGGGSEGERGTMADRRPGPRRGGTRTRVATAGRSPPAKVMPIDYRPIVPAGLVALTGLIVLLTQAFTPR